MQPFARMAGHVDVPVTQGPDRQRQGKSAGVPGLLKDRLIRFRQDSSMAEPAPHVVNAGHRCGSIGRPVPIMLSRVTNSASASSSIPALPDGRSGITM